VPFRANGIRNDPCSDRGYTIHRSFWSIAFFSASVQFIFLNRASSDLLRPGLIQQTNSIFPRSYCIVRYGPINSSPQASLATSDNRSSRAAAYSLLTSNFSPFTRTPVIHGSRIANLLRKWAILIHRTVIQSREATRDCYRVLNRFKI